MSVECMSLLPDKVGAVAAECGLLEESSDKFVVFNFVHVLLSQSSFPRESIDYGGVIDLYQMVSHRAAIPQVCVSSAARRVYCTRSAASLLLQRLSHLH